VCLGSHFQGGEVRFGPLRGEKKIALGASKSHTEEAVAVIEPQVGYAILHRGRQLHEVLIVKAAVQLMIMAMYLIMLI
jgi:hypothetical protein